MSKGIAKPRGAKPRVKQGARQGVRQRGFTLAELMIVIVIVSLLMTVALPAYQNQVRKTKRATGAALMVEIAQRLERCFTQFSSYTNAACPSGPWTNEDGSYSVTIASSPAATATSFTLLGTPQAGQAADKCMTLTLTSAGVEGTQGTGALPADKCW